MPLLRGQNEKYTYKDYLTWPDEERYELIDGIPHLQAAPIWQHQVISRELLIQFGNYLQGKPCQVFSTPFDLRLPESDEKDEDVANVLQPDILIICDKSRLKGTGYYGAPTLIIEIVSPSSGKMDKLYKFNKYEKAGVQEYWIVEPEEKIINVFTLLENNRYGRPDVYSEENSVKVGVFPDLLIELKSVFAY
ncbi:Uma2 family endonuclease [Hydrogenispora ethanolica]|uniref:Uma2 family endonuclease n=1 Tax=Hydrogenispora ethanolica TaxID=1082276 RepID=A0A4R1RVR2_HYDET|nr:Uma2 family endonuclease [Hydrogenispora ethanolica]TCL70741.1 Uma2 family endonuclease [Hydrogenispora ethanolica]